MLDLVRTAYGFNPDTILGGPNWLELDRFDLIAKVADGADVEAQKAMLQSLLEDRFKLVARKETKPIPTWVLAAGKQPRLKEADGSGQTGCRIPDASGGPPVEGGIRFFRMEPDGKQTQINLGPGGVVQYSCRNMTMAAFAAELRRMMGVQLGQEPVVDDTGLKGAWNFDVKWSIGLIASPESGRTDSSGRRHRQATRLEARTTADAETGARHREREPDADAKPGESRRTPPDAAGAHGIRSGGREARGASQSLAAADDHDADAARRAVYVPRLPDAASAVARVQQQQQRAAGRRARPVSTRCGSTSSRRRHRTR